MLARQEAPDNRDEDLMMGGPGCEALIHPRCQPASQQASQPASQLATRTITPPQYSRPRNGRAPSRVSSKLNLDLTVVAKNRQITADMMPIMRPPKGPTKPAAGVMAARPAMAPVAAPSVVGLPTAGSVQSSRAQVMVATAAEMWDTVMAMAAAASAASALPPLKPNHPTC